MRRFAAVLGVTNSALVRWLLPESGPYTYTDAVNGTERRGAAITDALTRATGVVTIASTGLATVGGLHLRRDFAPIRRWCPICLRELGYDALVLSLKTVTRCPIHGTPLLSRCVNGHVQRTWAAWARPDRCAECGADLAAGDHELGTPDPTSRAAAAVVAFIQEGKAVEERRVAAWARQHRGATSLRTCAGHFGWDLKTVINIEGGAQRLQFSTVTTLIVRGDTTVAELHRLDPVEVALRTPRRGPVSARVDVPSLRRAVRRELEKPIPERRGLVPLARGLGVSHITLRRHVPEIDVLIAERLAASPTGDREAA